MAATVRIGIIGAGWMAREHIRRLSAIPAAVVTAVCDVDEARADAAARPLGAAVYTDARRLLADEKLDAVYVCVPPHAHGDLERLAARRGLHLYVEKPIELSLARALATSRAIREAGVLNQVGYDGRYAPGCIQLKEFLADKEVGTAAVIRWVGLSEKDWWRRRDQGGGFLFSVATHQIDLLRWVLGEVQSVCGQHSVGRLFRDLPDVTIPDSEAALLRFESGASATVSASCGIGGGWQGLVTFTVRDAMVTLSWGGDRVDVAPEGTCAMPPPPQETPNADEAFVRAVQTGDPSLLRSPYDDAVRTTAVALAAMRSAERGGELVDVDEFLRAADHGT